MDFIPQIDLKEFDYILPEDRIPRYPAKDRSQSKMLYCDVNANNIETKKFADIVGLMPSDAFLVMNSTKVIAARLLCKKETGGKAEILVVEPISPSNDPQVTMTTHNKCVWECIIGGRAISTGAILSPIQNDNLICEVLEKEGNKAKVEFRWEENISFAEMIEQTGKIPLPPYIKRDTEESDKDRYQTVYAKTEGSVAAPTAGLHFTDEILSKLKTKGIEQGEVLLHVGPGTFKPISDGDVSTHDMHREQIFIEKSFISSITEYFRSGKNNVIATGTTSLRTLESLYWYGVKLLLKETTEANIYVHQWDPYRITKEIDTLPSPYEAMNAILDLMNESQIEIISGKTQLFIMPGYKLNMINGIITNFHMPQSTLILLVAAFTGKKLWRKMYNYALENDFNFLSYGDSSFLIKKEPQSS
jgi:S-adenosylmethionine:tRNA ribosyltransferase-isomerase